MKFVHYPDTDKQDALADQIEMKILPKLNGVDADLVRDKVRVPITEVLAAIRDTEVTEALNQTQHVVNFRLAYFGRRVLGRLSPRVTF